MNVTTRQDGLDAMQSVQNKICDVDEIESSARIFLSFYLGKETFGTQDRAIFWVKQMASDCFFPEKFLAQIPLQHFPGARHKVRLGESAAMQKAMEMQMQINVNLKMYLLNVLLTY